MNSFLRLLCATLFSLPLFAVPFMEPWGKDSGLAQREHYPPPNKRADPVGRVADALLGFYQNHLSPTNGPRSHFRPSSSQYMRLAIRRYGFLQGYIMGCDRLLRENKDPWVYRTIVYGDAEYKYDPTL